MPFYEYECSACKHHTEVLQKISEAPLRKCPSCGKQALKRLISAPVFRLKGGGWYETDFKSGNEQKRNLAGGEDAGESKAETKSEDSASTQSSSNKEAAKPADSKSAEATPAVAKSAAAKPDPAASRSASKTAAKPAPRRDSKPSKAKAPAKKKSARR
jgi:putative FmdB family regulatory protein